ncbi:hypothetical protein SDRG_06518 [Saprolegnia diclina VS20]|uniref:START domain-containing protein n=1 Tax=Saprolegnia diclina (strain VS20) TaxID=1156394 RepID=T0QCY4_SAPDV|nr:hypothetical protein SDRG_06518 [Saprolegnia diclina VS20]EQC35759.1 hypothetical protein SDRG_06518 [Saprolegnia diclina VS20]|eukprot:XP_008610521.1 hypothetical protein SDRG_06518 [Saprolegnia diclina VS20]
MGDDAHKAVEAWLGGVELPTTASPKKLSSFQRHQLKQKNELLYLQAKVAELQEQVRVLKESAELTAMIQPPSLWEQLAKRERKRRLQAVRENDRLQATLQDQVKFAESLAAIVRKRPRLSLFGAACEKPWKTASLGVRHSHRVTTAHALLDDEYANIDGAYIEARLVDSTHDHRQYLAHVVHGAVEVHTILQWTMHTAVETAFRCVWDVIRGAYPVRSVGGVYTLLEELDESTAYVHSVCHYTVGTMLRRVVMRRYMEPSGRCVIVARNVTSDALHPTEPGLDISEEVSWLVLEPTGTATVVAKYFQKSKPAFKDFRPAEIQEPESKYLMELYGSYCDGFIATMESLVDGDTSGGSSSEESH